MADAIPRIPIGIGNVDKALGGGLVRGSAILLSGDSGAGKSTLALRILEALGARALYVSTEETPEQIEDRVARTQCGIGVPLFCPMPAELESMLQFAPEYEAIVIDSLHALRGNLKQNAKILVDYCKDTGAIVLCIARLVKDGSIEGNASIGYDFDVDLCIDKTSNVARTLRTGLKNRYGSAGAWPLWLTAKGWEDPPQFPDEETPEELERKAIQEDSRG
jgi:KaiC